MGKRNRLKSRFKGYDDELARWTGLSAIGFLISFCLLSAWLGTLNAPQWLKATLVVIFAVASLLLVLLGNALIPRRIGAKHGLICRNCGGLVRQYPSRLRPNDPDRPANGRIPARCPSCHVDIAIATQPPRDEAATGQ